MSKTFTGQAQNVAIVDITGSDITGANPLPVSMAGGAASLGQKTMANSSPVVIASDQTVIPVGVTSTAKGATAVSNVTSTSVSADHQGMDVVEQFAPVYEDNGAGRALVEQRNNYTNITSATTTVVKNTGGFLHMIMVNKAVASATITIYDNTSAAAPIFATVTMPAVLLSSQVNLRYDVSFATGLTIVTTGAQDLTVSWR